MCVNFKEYDSFLNQGISKFKVLSFDRLCEIKIFKKTQSLLINIQKYDVDILNELASIKGCYPSLAIIICSNRYIEKLSFWCLRNKMLDYVILPNEFSYLNEKLSILYEINDPLNQEKRKP